MRFALQAIAILVMPLVPTVPLALVNVQV